MFESVNSSQNGISSRGFLAQNQFEQSDNGKDMPFCVQSTNVFPINSLQQLDCCTSGVQNNAMPDTQETISPTESSEGDLISVGLEGFNTQMGYLPPILNQRFQHDQPQVSYGNPPKVSFEDRCSTPKALLDVLFQLQEKIQKLVDAVQLMDNEGVQNVQRESVEGSVTLIMSQLFITTSSLLQHQNLPSTLQHHVHFSSPQPSLLENQIPPPTLQPHAQFLPQPSQMFDMRLDGFNNDGMTNSSLFAPFGTFMHENFFSSSEVETSISTPDIGGASSGGVVDLEPLKEQDKNHSSAEDKTSIYSEDTMENIDQNIVTQHGNVIQSTIPNQKPTNLIEANSIHMISDIRSKALMSTEDHKINCNVQNNALKKNPNNGAESDLDGLDFLGRGAVMSTKDYDMFNKFREEDEDGEAESLPLGSYELIEMAATEILAEHTHFCNICGKGFKRDANLRMHMRGHGDEYKTPAALARPDKAIHDPSTIKIRRYSCPYLGCKRNKNHRKFNPLKTMLCVKNHYKRSHCPKLLTCTKCKMKKFSVVADLKTHEKHCGKDKWQCSCGTTFSRKDKLVGHMGLFAGHTLMYEMDSHVDGNVESSGRLSSGYGHGLEDIQQFRDESWYNLQTSLNASSQMDKSKTIHGVNVLSCSTTGNETHG